MIMLDGGSGRCEALLRPPGMTTDLTEPQNTMRATFIRAARQPTGALALLMPRLCAPGVSEREARKLKSLTCSARNEVY